MESIDEKSYQLVLFGDSISKGVVFDEKKKKYVLIKNNFSNIIKEKFNNGTAQCSKVWQYYYTGT